LLIVLETLVLKTKKVLITPNELINNFF
jgi:hypothetical protein